MSHTTKLLPSLAVALSLAAGLGAQLPFKKPGAVPYRLTYAYTKRSLPDRKILDKGLLTLGESRRALVIEEVGQDERTSLVYSGEKTLKISHPRKGSQKEANNKSGIYSDGFAAGDYELPVYWPFDYANVSPYKPLNVAIDAWKKEASPISAELLRRVGDSNLSLASNPGKSEQRYTPGKVEVDPASGQVRSLVVGGQFLKYAEYHFDGFTQSRSMSVPKSFTMVRYDYPKPTSERTAPASETRYELEKVEAGAAQTATGPEGILEKGDWLTYEGFGGKTAGVTFSPAQGDLEKQLNEQLGLLAHAPKSKADQTNDGPPLWMPTTLALASAAGAAYFLRRRKPG